VLRISILALNFLEMGGFTPKFSVFRRKFFDTKKIFNMLKYMVRGTCPPLPPCTTSPSVASARTDAIGLAQLEIIINAYSAKEGSRYATR